jgi:hypothetical protein
MAKSLEKAFKTDRNMLMLAFIGYDAEQATGSRVMKRIGGDFCWLVRRATVNQDSRRAAVGRQVLVAKDR